MICFVGSSLFLVNRAKLKGAMQMILLMSVICVASGFTLEMPETPRSDWHRGKSLWWKFHVENGGGTKGVPSQGLAD